jgi:hypothetical protein
MGDATYVAALPASGPSRFPSRLFEWLPLSRVVRVDAEARVSVKKNVVAHARHRARDASSARDVKQARLRRSGSPVAACGDAPILVSKISHLSSSADGVRAARSLLTTLDTAFAAPPTSAQTDSVRAIFSSTKVW